MRTSVKKRGKIHPRVTYILQQLGIGYNHKCVFAKWHQEYFEVIPRIRFFLTIATDWLGKAWQGCSQYLEVQSMVRSMLEERKEDLTLLMNGPGAGCCLEDGASLPLKACTLTLTDLGGGFLVVVVVGGVFL